MNVFPLMFALNFLEILKILPMDTRHKGHADPILPEGEKFAVTVIYEN